MFPSPPSPWWHAHSVKRRPLKGYMSVPLRPRLIAAAVDAALSPSRLS